MPVNVDLVAEVGVLGDVRRRYDVLDPEDQPARDGPSLPGLAHGALVPFALQHPDLRSNLAAGPASHVAAVRTAVVPNSHSDAAVPAAIGALVDRRPHVGVTAPLGLRRGLVRR